MKFSNYFYRSVIETLLVSLSFFFLLIFLQYRGENIGIFELSNWRYVHLGDASENIKNGLFLAKGGKLNEYVTSNHMPGLYLYLSLFFSVLPKDLLVNSLSNGIFVLVFSSFITIFTIVGLSFYSIRLVVRDERLTFFVKVVFYFILLDLFVTFNYFRVLSETYLPFLQLTYLSLFYYYLRDTNDRFGYLVSALYFIGLSIFFGLTNIFTDFLFFIFFSIYLVKDFRKIRIKHILPAIVLFGFILIKSGNLNFHYWIVETNKAQGLGSGSGLFLTILGNAFIWPGNWYELRAFGPVYDHKVLVIILGIITIFVYRKNRSLLIFLSLCLLVLPLDSWRIPEQGFVLVSQSYKTDVNIGICFFFLLALSPKIKISIDFLFEIFSTKINFKIDRALVKIGLLLLVLFFSLRLVSYLTNFIELERIILFNHSSWISQQNICKQKFIRPNTDCSCLSLMHWDQEFFLINDVRPCANQFSSYSPHLNADDTYYNTVKSSFLDRKAAFLLSYADLYTKQSILSPRLIELFRSGECEMVEKDTLYLCKNGN